jgi:hypothetical protein
MTVKDALKGALYSKQKKLCIVNIVKRHSKVLKGAGREGSVK